MAGRRLQEWTNRNLFIGSFDSSAGIDPDAASSRASPNTYAVQNQLYQNAWSDEPQNDSYQNQQPNETFELTVAPKPDDLPLPELQSDPTGDHEAITPGGRLITALQACWNVTNAIQGMFIVGLPFAVKVGGWTTLFALVFVAYICYRTGLSLIDCLYDDGKKVRHSYREIAEAVRPGLGILVLAAQLTELASTCILYIVLAGDLLQGCAPGIDRPAWMMIITVILLGTAFLDDIRIVSHLSLANAVSHLVINAIMVLYCFSQFTNWRFTSVALIPNFRLLPTVIGVVVFGYTSHIFLPSLEGSMKDPTEFKSMLARSHIAAALFKSIFGLIGFLTFAEFTQREISNSLPNQAFKVLVNLVLVTKALLSYPLPYFAIVQLLTENFFRGVRFTPFSSCYGTDKQLREWAVGLRILLILWTLWMALSVPYLVELMGLIGNITGTVLSFIWPAYFHLKLKGDKMDDKLRRFNKFVIWMGAGICVFGIYYSALELLNAIQRNRQ